jgi:hypothetical protein
MLIFVSDVTLALEPIHFHYCQCVENKFHNMLVIFKSTRKKNCVIIKDQVNGKL